MTTYERNRIFQTSVFFWRLQNIENNVIAKVSAVIVKQFVFILLEFTPFKS